MIEPRVIQIIDSSHIGGAEVLAINIANGLAQEKIESHICITREEGALSKNINASVSLICLSKKKPLDFKAIFKLKNYCKENQINILHAHTNSFFIAFMVKLFYWNVKIFWHNHTGANIDLGGNKMTIIKALSFFFYGIIHVDKDLFDWGQKKLFAKNNFFIRNFPVFTDLSSVTKLNGIIDKRIVCIAGFRKEKNHLNLLSAFKCLSEKYDKWTLHLVGKDYGDDYSQEIRKFIQDHNLQKKVFLYGMREDIKNILSQSTIGVLSSDTEGLPVSLLEYGMASLPVVTTDVGECSQIIKDKRFLVIPSNSNKLAKALGLLINSERERDDLSKSIHEIVVKDYSKLETISKLINLYKSTS